MFSFISVYQREKAFVKHQSGDSRHKATALLWAPEEPEEGKHLFKSPTKLVNLKTPIC